ncbi:MAG TPA: hypothetical protein VKY32_06640 [Flavobacterium sp.]|nr:hypothetical protein [Flavobacterium sp.]
MKNGLLIIFSLFLWGCNTDKRDLNDLEKAFTDLKEDEYWGLYYHNDECFKFRNRYIKFYQDGTYKDFSWYRNGNRIETDSYETKLWKVTEDSIFYYNFRFQYKVVLINDGVILVSKGDKKVDLMFIKESEKHLRKRDWELHSDSLKLENPIPYEKWLEIMNED